MAEAAEPSGVSTYAFTHPETGELIRRRERVGYSEVEAHEALQSRLTDIRREKFDRILPEPTTTLKDIWPKYHAYISTPDKKGEATNSPGWVLRKEGIYENQLLPFFSDTQLQRITVGQVEQFRIKRKKDKVSNGTINKEVQTLQNILKIAVEWGDIQAGIPFLSPSPLGEKAPAGGSSAALGNSRVPKEKAVREWCTVGRTAVSLYRGKAIESFSRAQDVVKYLKRAI